jgi:nitroreductase
METWDAIRSRRNVRAFADRPIADEDLGRILEAAWRTPSSTRRRPLAPIGRPDRRPFDSVVHRGRW